MKHLLMGVTLAAAALAGTAVGAEACSRVLYTGTDSLRIVGRSLDWQNPIPTNIYVYPRGIAKQSYNSDNAIKWTSRYGAVYAVGYDGGVTEGMNEKGLSVNGLFCKSAVYGNESTEGRPPMSLAMFPAWLLDLCATTDEAVAMLERHDFNITGATFDGGTVSTLHWGITDQSGASAVVEFVDGVIKIYRGQDLPVLTNAPTYPEMEALEAYWKEVGGTNMLPGTVRSQDRFVRGAFFDGAVERTADADLGVSICRTVLMNICVPYTYKPAEKPVPYTQWRSFSNLRDLRYYFELATGMGLYYVDLNQIKLTPGSPVLKIDTTKAGLYVGDATSRLFVTEPFTPMY